MVYRDKGEDVLTITGPGNEMPRLMNNNADRQPTFSSSTAKREGPCGLRVLRSIDLHPVEWSAWPSGYGQNGRRNPQCGFFRTRCRRSARRGTSKSRGKVKTRAGRKAGMAQAEIGHALSRARGLQPVGCKPARACCVTLAPTTASALTNAGRFLFNTQLHPCIPCTTRPQRTTCRRDRGST